VSFSYKGQVVSEAPENVPQIGQPVNIPLQGSAVCGVLYVDKHKVQGVLSGVLSWILNTVVEIETCQNDGPCYHSLSDAIVNSIDCSQIDDFTAQIACSAFADGLASKLQDAIDSWLLHYSLMTLKGTALVGSNGQQLTNGHWDGTLGDGASLFKNFDGDWSGHR
jgi:hypothetical protein